MLIKLSIFCLLADIIEYKSILVKVTRAQ